MAIHKKTVLVVTVCFTIFGILKVFPVNQSQKYGTKDDESGDGPSPVKVPKKGNLAKTETLHEVKDTDDIFYNISANLATITSENVSVINCTKIKFSPQFPICVHDTGDFLSRVYSQGMIWEYHIIQLVKRILNSDPEIGLIDLGANLGYYSLLAGTLGRRVLAVEPLTMNVIRFHKAAKLTGIDKYITLIQAGVSNKREERLICVKRTNIGSSMVKNNYKDPKDQYKLKTVLMRDLLKYVTFTKTLLKIDIEGSEGVAMQNTSELFRKLDICYIFMETLSLRKFFCRKKNDPRYLQFNKIAKDLESRNYVAYNLDIGKNHTLVNTKLCWTWPIDTLWKRSDCELPWKL